MNIRQIVTDRIGDGWNDWPDLPIVKISSYNLTDPEKALDYGISYGYADAVGQPRQVAPKNLPELVKAYLEGVGWESWLYTVRISVKYVGMGNTDPSNLMVWFNPNRIKNVGLAIEVGCDHNVTATQLGNCYARYRCSKCGMIYEVDSSG